MSELSYIRMENSLLRAFDSIPTIEVPPAGGKTAPRISSSCALTNRTTSKPSKTKIKMFNDAEIKIFRRSGCCPSSSAKR